VACGASGIFLGASVSPLILFRLRVRGGCLGAGVGVVADEFFQEFTNQSYLLVVQNVAEVYTIRVPWLCFCITPERTFLRGPVYVLCFLRALTQELPPCGSRFFSMFHLRASAVWRRILRTLIGRLPLPTGIAAMPHPAYRVMTP